MSSLTRAAQGAGLLKAPDYKDEALVVDRVVKEGDILNFGDHKITVYETPGHTKCSPVRHGGSGCDLCE